MAYCLTAPSHFLNQCWLIISGDIWYSPMGNFTWNAQYLIHDMSLKVYDLRLQPNLPAAAKEVIVKRRDFPRAEYAELLDVYCIQKLNDIFSSSRMQNFSHFIWTLQYTNMSVMSYQNMENGNKHVFIIVGYRYITVPHNTILNTPT